MKQKVLLLMVLALGICSINLNAQTKEYKVEDDGFKWNLVWDENGERKYGAEDSYGNMIIPKEYSYVSYSSDRNPILTGFLCRKGDYYAWYSVNGQCIIPYTRKYTWIYKKQEDEFGTFYYYQMSDRAGILDRYGIPVVSVKADGIDIIRLASLFVNGKLIYFIDIIIKKGGKKYYGVADANGKIVVAPEYKEEDMSIARDLAWGRIMTTTNPLARNKIKTLEEAQSGLADEGGSHSSSSSSSSSSKNNSSSTSTANKHQSYSDAQYFGFKGNIKKCKWVSQATPLENFPWFDKEIQFSRQGKIILQGHEIVRESSGRITKIDKGLNTYHFYYDSNNRINCIKQVVFNIFGEDLVHKYYYTYDSQGRIISSNFDYDALGRSVFDYKNFVNDSKGNWIKCNSSTTHKRLGRQVYTPKREITYY